MANGIKIGNFDVSYFKVGNADCKIYLGDTLLYPHSTPVQEPCFAVVDNISQYSDTEFEDVFNLADEKWYKLNNLNQYEQYGIYGSGKNITYYEGKLTVDDGDEYEWNGSSWVNLGEVSGSSRVPVGYTEVEYIENTGTSYLNIAFTPNQDTRVLCDMQLVTASNYPRLWGAGAWNSAAGINLNYEGGYLQMSWLGKTSWTKYTSVTQSFDRKVYDVNKNYLYVDSVQIGSNTYTTRTASGPIGVFTYIGSGRPSSSRYWGQEHFKGKMYSFKVYDNGTLVRDLVPCKRGNDNTVGAYDIVNNVFYTVPTGYTTDKLIAGAETGTIEYPVYYDEKADPPDNLVFTSMEEAEEYECPWWGMTGIITNTDYLFCETNTWLTKYDYQEVSGEYLCDGGNKYKKLEEWDRNVDGTISATSIYVKGDLIETASPDCPQCTVNFCGVAANGNTVTINNGTSTLTRSNWTSPYPVEGTVGAATTTIGMYCFQNVSSTISALTIENTVTTIEHEAFMETAKLTTLTIPSNVTQIDFWAFTRCNGLQEVIFEGTTPPTFTNQHSGVFHDYCPPVIYVPDSAVAAYRAIGGSVWTNQTWSTNIIQPISNRP